MSASAPLFDELTNALNYCTTVYNYNILYFEGLDFIRDTCKWNSEQYSKGSQEIIKIGRLISSAVDLKLIF